MPVEQVAEFEVFAEHVECLMAAGPPELGGVGACGHAGAEGAALQADAAELVRSEARRCGTRLDGPPIDAASAAQCRSRGGEGGIRGGLSRQADAPEHRPLGDRGGVEPACQRGAAVRWGRGRPAGPCLRGGDCGRRRFVGAIPSRTNYGFRGLNRVERSGKARIFRRFALAIPSGCRGNPPPHVSVTLKTAILNSDPAQISNCHNSRCRRGLARRRPGPNAATPSRIAVGARNHRPRARKQRISCSD